ncbi:hypothetical protein GE061_010714 [Apolygus lucorum]|uniref:Uncharacterized protein n=1 Tax=Apolygus lucorum TaxID=248454 RepID=A0A6A4JKV6_APOLU|nr:hypothetical protein GE061_010714 [Apolygus lucorum]
MEIESGICQDGECLFFRVLPRRVLIKFRVHSKKAGTGEFRIKNVSKEPQAITIVPPMSEYFHVTPLLAKGFALPGETIRVVVSLRSDLDPRIHYDVVNVSCPKGCSVDVALEAIPKVKTLKTIPRIMNFGHVPLGQKRVKKIVLRPLKSDMPYIFMCGGSCQDLDISPTRGVVRTGGPPAEITITYKSTAYITLHAEVSLYLPSVIFNPYVFTVTAYTEPGFARTEILRKPSEEKMIVNPLKERFFTHPTWLLKKPKFVPPKKNLPIWSQHRTNKLLFKQMQEKRSEFELLGPLGRYLDEEESIVKSKEQGFFEGVTHVHRDNYLAPYHTRTKLRPVETPALNREPMWTDYMKQYEIPTYNNHGQPLYIRQRTVKWMDSEDKMRRFTDRLPNIWFPRYVTMGKFIEAARRIIHKNRMMKVLKKLRELTKKSVIAFETPPIDPF